MYYNSGISVVSSYFTPTEMSLKLLTPKVLMTTAETIFLFYFIFYFYFYFIYFIFFILFIYFLFIFAEQTIHMKC